MKRPVTVNIGEFSVEALTGGHDEHLPDRLVQALRLYLGDRGSDRPGWVYPTALPEQDGEVELELTVDDDLWRAFEQEAERQDVSVSKLAGHAALYYAAEVDAGRITERILERLNGEGIGGEAPEGGEA